MKIIQLYTRNTLSACQCRTAAHGHMVELNILRLINKQQTATPTAKGITLFLQKPIKKLLISYVRLSIVTINDHDHTYRFLLQAIVSTVFEMKSDYDLCVSECVSVCAFYFYFVYNL